MKLLFISVCLLFSVTASAEEPRPKIDSCVACHGDAARMKELGYPHFAVTAEEVSRQSGMTAVCSDCHLGDRTAQGRDEAHRGLKRLLVVRKQGLIAEPADRKAPLMVTGGPVQRLKHQVLKDGKAVVDNSVTSILYQDKLPETLGQDFAAMEQTCGQCHADVVAGFRQSPMGRNVKQSTYRTWNEKERGPHNCGIWSDGNLDRIAAGSTVPFTPAQSALNQRTCNGCHVGCLDCHYYPTAPDPQEPRSGMHVFRRDPPPETCYGGGRGQTCHAGPEDRRRGSGYFAGPFSFPEGLAPDVHKTRKVGCLDCHPSSRNDRQLSHGTVRRQATCDRCHAGRLASHAASKHRMLSCEACHIRESGGYQATFWGPGRLAGLETPLYKYKDYYGILSDPILIRDQTGRWIPVKPFPMAVMNQKGADFKPGLHWRYPVSLPPADRTDDAWGFVGMVDGLPENNSALLWVQMDKLSHRFGKARPCVSCHADPEGTQLRHVRWDFGDNGALPFSGSHDVVADRTGLFIKNMNAKDSVEPTDGVKQSSFAPWLYLKDRWFVPGDFSLPKIRDRKGYASGEASLDEARKLGIVHK